MSEKDHDIKHVIILDDNIKNKRDDRDDIADESDELLKELDESLEDTEKYRRPGKEPLQEDTEYPPRKKAGKVSGRLRKHITVLAVSLVLLVLLVIVGINRADGGYREPVRVYEEFLNKEAYNGEDVSYAFANGLAKKQLKDLRSALHKSDEYIKMLEGSENASRLSHDSDSVSTVTIDEARPLDKDSLLMYEEDFRGIMSDLSVSSYAVADDRELSEAVKALTDSLKDAHITDGYRLYCTVRSRSGEAEGPAERVEKAEFTVVRLDGHWIMWDKIYDVFRMTF